MNVLTIEEANRMILPGRTKEEYQRDYDYIIELARPRGLDKSKIDFYCETHHCLARCLGGTDENDNLVNLSFLEHIVCHILLFRIYPKVSKLMFAAFGMINGMALRNKGDLFLELEELISKLDFNTLLELKKCYINNKSKAVVCIESLINPTRVVRIYNSETEAEKDFNSRAGLVHQAIKRRTRFSNYYWDFLETFKEKYPNLIKEYNRLEIKNKLPKIIFPIKKSEDYYKIVCYSIFSNKIYKIYDSILNTTLDGFSKTRINSAVNKKLSPFKVNKFILEGIEQGYRWKRLSEWEDKNELDKYYKSSVLYPPIPFNINAGILKISKDNRILEEYSSLNKTINGINLANRFFRDKSIILEIDDERWIRVKDYVKLFEDKWLDYLRHKQEQDNIKPETNE